MKELLFQYKDASDDGKEGKEATVNEQMTALVMASWDAKLKTAKVNKSDSIQERNNKSSSAIVGASISLEKLKSEQESYHQMRRKARCMYPILTRDVDDDTTSFLSMDLDDEDIDVEDEMKKVREKKAAFKKKMEQHIHRQECLTLSQSDIIVSNVMNQLGGVGPKND